MPVFKIIISFISFHPHSNPRGSVHQALHHHTGEGLEAELPSDLLVT